MFPVDYADTQNISGLVPRRVRRITQNRSPQSVQYVAELISRRVRRITQNRCLQSTRNRTELVPRRVRKITQKYDADIERVSATLSDFCGKNNSVYANTLRLFNQIKMAKADGSSLRELAKIEKQDLLILDDFGVQPFDAQIRLTLLEIMEDRHGKRSTIFAPQLPVKQWYEVMGRRQLPRPILDRMTLTG